MTDGVTRRPPAGAARWARWVLLVLVAGAAGAAVAPSAASPGAASLAWSDVTRTLPDGRVYAARVPSCVPAGSAGCANLLSEPRAVVFFLHGAGAAEDAASTTYWLDALHSLAPAAVVVFGISKGDSRRWDGGVCCTAAAVDDVGYLVEVVDDLAGRWAVARDRVGAIGLSNGGMLALRATCERPDVVTAVAALAATYAGACGKGTVRVAQWHGALDPVVPLEGGDPVVLGARRSFPPVASLAQRMVPGSVFLLNVLPGRGHAMSWAEYRPAMRWLLAQLQ